MKKITELSGGNSAQIKNRHNELFYKLLEKAKSK
jgi:hypothetical protein